MSEPRRRGGAAGAAGKPLMEPDESQRSTTDAQTPQNPNFAGRAEFDFLTGMVIGIGLVTEGTLLSLDGRRILSACFKFLSAAELLIIFVFFAIRVYLNQPRAAERWYLVTLSPFFVTMIGFIVWAAIDVLTHPEVAI
jgi:hypothetical protein